MSGHERDCRAYGRCSPEFRVVETPPADGFFNMALDEALMESVREGGAPILRFYRWSPACLSLGRNQPARDVYDRAALERLGIDVVRRPTGGRAVLHARELTYSVVAPAEWGGGPRESYRRINRALAAGLRRLGVPASIQGDSGARAPVPSAEPCFRAPVEGEVVAAGRKLIGSAQVREGRVMLQHGSLLLHDDQALLAEVGPVSSGAPGTLAAHLDPLPDWSDLVAALRSGWEELEEVQLTPDEPSNSVLRRARELARSHADREWIWRR